MIAVMKIGDSNRGDKSKDEYDPLVTSPLLICTYLVFYDADGNAHIADSDNDGDAEDDKMYDDKDDEDDVDVDGVEDQMIGGVSHT